MAYNSSYNIDQDGLFCKFCQKQCKNKNSLAQHQVRCKQNPNRIISNVLTEYVRKEDVLRGLDTWEMTPEEEFDEAVYLYENFNIELPEEFKQEYQRRYL